MKSLISLVVIFFTLFACTNAGQILTIDDFELGQPLTSGYLYSINVPQNAIFPLVDDGYESTSSIIGGERDIILTVYQSDENLNFSSFVASGKWGLLFPSSPQNGIEPEGDVVYQLDGFDGSSALTNGNITPIDLTAFGTTTVLSLDTESDVDFDCEIHVYEVGNNTPAIYTLLVPDSSGIQQDVDHSLFTGAIDFSNVGALEIVANSGRLANVDASISFFGIRVSVIEGLAYLDCNNNGFDNSDTSYAGVTVTLKDGNGSVVDTTTTDNNGLYTFTVPTGTYMVCLDTPNIPQDQFTVPSNGCTPNFTLNTANDDRTDDTFGFIIPITISGPEDRLNLDCNACTDASAASGCTGMATGTACDSSAVQISVDDNVTQQCSGTYTINRTFTATDGTSSVSTQQTITVVDSTAPAFGNDFPGPVVYQCGDDTTPSTFPTATDNCSDAVVAYTDVPSSQGCTEPLDRVWTATDDCNNQTSRIQQVTIADNAPPQFTFEPQDTSVQCLDDNISGGPAQASDVCNPTGVTVTFTDTSPGNTCNGAITRTWTASDICQNSSVYTQFITVQDDQPPNLNVPPTFTGSCDDDFTPSSSPNGPGQATATDNCSSDPTVSYQDGTAAGSCSDGFTRTWTATDGCNTSTGEQTIIIQDVEPPTFVTFPEDQVIDCSSANNGGVTQPTGTDACSGINSAATTYVDSSPTGNTCNQSFTRTWTIYDICGNQASSQQLLSTVDTKSPTIIAPSPAVVDCSVPNGQTPIPEEVTGSPTVTDDCSGSVTYTAQTVVSDDNSCNFVYTRTFTATDNCNEPAVATQTITIVDNGNPSFINFPPTREVQCTSENGGANIDPSVTGSPSGTDECQVNLTITYSDVELNDLCPDGIDVQRTWTVMDNCGHSATQVQEIDIVNTFAPTVVAPPDVAVACDQSTDPNNPDIGFATATGTCDPNLVPTYTDSPSGTGCSRTISREWTATNACGQSGSDTQIINLSDNVAPSFSPFVAPEISLSCEDDTSPSGPAGTPTVVDNCDTEPTLTWTDTQSQDPVGFGQCPGPVTIRRVWSTSDACLNTHTQLQIITVDQQGPSACEPVECLPVACDTSDCPNAECECCGEDAKECEQSECLSALCEPELCLPNGCNNCGDGSTLGTTGCQPVPCSPVFVYYDDEDLAENPSLAYGVDGVVV